MLNSAKSPFKYRNYTGQLQVGEGVVQQHYWNTYFNDLNADKENGYLREEQIKREYEISIANVVKLKRNFDIILHTFSA